jgi:4-amino-4-deoxy-L-arabinose transferase-like glycosyltransferase
MTFVATSIRRIPIGLWAVLLGAAILRIAYLLEYAASPEWAMLTVDNYYHIHWAESIAGGNIFGSTTYFRAPLYIYCLAFLSAATDALVIAARVFGITIGLASIAMTYAIGSKIGSARVGLIAAALHAIYPVTLYFESEILLDPLFMLLLQIALYRFLVWDERRRNVDLFWTGLALGLASITRPTSLTLAALALIAIVMYRDRWGMTVRRATLFLAGLFLIVAPISIRNSVVSGEFVLISSQGGINLFIGNHAKADGVSATLRPVDHCCQEKCPLTGRMPQSTLSCPIR